MRRRLPEPAALRHLVKLRKPILNPTRRRLSNCFTVEDLEKAARRRTPRPVFDYVDGGADRETTVERTRRAFLDATFHPDALRDVSAVDTSTQVLGRTSRLPFGIAPTGFTRMVNSEGELAGAAAAAAAGIPFSLSTMGTTSIEDVAGSSPTGRNWFQLYVWKDRQRSAELLHRAAHAGFDSLLVTVDVPVPGARLRDVRNGLTIPPSITPRTLAQVLARPRWWFDVLTTEPLTFASLTALSGDFTEQTRSVFDPSVTMQDLEWVRSEWPGKLVVKGVQTVRDAVQFCSADVDAVLLSNHGGRQLDRAPVPLYLLPAVRQAVPSRVEVHLDSGIRHGQDIVAALALGADFTLIGRSYLYGLMAGGRRGVDRAINILESEIVRTMQLLGVTALSQLREDHVSLLGQTPR